MSESLLLEARHDEVAGELKRIISDILQVPPDVLKADSKLSDLTHVESIKLLRIAGKIERRFGIEFEDEVVLLRGSLGDVIAEVVRLTRTGQSGTP